MDYINSFSPFLALFLQGYLFRCHTARDDFRKKYLRPIIDRFGGVLAWVLTFLCVAAMFGALYCALWLGYFLGFDM